MVASVAWGFVAREAYLVHRHTVPKGWNTFFFGDPGQADPQFVVTAGLLVIGQKFERNQTPLSDMSLWAALVVGLLGVIACREGPARNRPVWGQPLSNGP